MNRYRALLAALVAAYVLVATRNITSPFVRHWELLSACNAQFARNQNRFGIGTTRLAALSVFGDRLDNYRDYRTQFYSRHPFVPQVTGIALAFRLFGEREWALRACLIAVAVLNLLLFAALARRLLGEGKALVAATIFAFNPLFGYFSQVVPELGFTLLFVLASLLSYLRWLERGRRIDLTIMFASSFLACWSDWFGYGAALVVFLHLVFVLRKHRAIGVLFLGAHLLFFASYVGYVFGLEPRDGTVLRELFQRGNTAVGGIERFGPIAYLRREGRECLVYFTPPMLLLNGIWIVRFCRRRTPQEWFVLLSAALGLYEFVFFDLAFVHDFYTFTLLPTTTLGAALGVGVVREALGRRRVAATVLCGGALCLILAQSGYVLRNRLFQEAAYRVSYEMGATIRDATAPGARVLAVAQPIHQYVIGFYADRYVQCYSPPDCALHHGMGPADTVAGVDEAGFLRLAREQYDSVILIDRASAPEKIEYLRSRPREEFLLNYLRAEPADSTLVRGLGEIGRARGDSGGFLVFQMRERP